MTVHTYTCLRKMGVASGDEPDVKLVCRYASYYQSKFGGRAPCTRAYSREQDVQLLVHPPPFQGLDPPLDTLGIGQVLFIYFILLIFKRFPKGSGEPITCHVMGVSDTTNNKLLYTSAPMQTEKIINH